MTDMKVTPKAPSSNILPHSWENELPLQGQGHLKQAEAKGMLETSEGPGTPQRCPQLQYPPLLVQPQFITNIAH